MNNLTTGTKIEFTAPKGTFTLTITSIDIDLDFDYVYINYTQYCHETGETKKTSCAIEQMKSVIKKYNATITKETPAPVKTTFEEKEIIEVSHAAAYTNKYSVSTNINLKECRGVKLVSDGSNHENGLQRYLLTESKLNKEVLNKYTPELIKWV